MIDNHLATVSDALQQWLLGPYAALIQLGVLIIFLCLKRFINPSSLPGPI